MGEVATGGSVLKGEVPVVDLADLSAGDDALRARFTANLGAALKEYGFVRVRGHGVGPALVDPAYAAGMRFFARSEAEKATYIVKNGAGQRGYTPFGAEHAKDSPKPDLKEFWHVGRELPADHKYKALYQDNLWPEGAEDFRAAMLAVYGALENVSKQLLECIAEYLDLSPYHLREMTDYGNTILRVLHYPPMNQLNAVPGAVRAGAHEDINFITLLVTSTAAGLELLRRDGQWMAVNAEPGEIVADVGDMLSRVTNGLLPATTHRVVNPDDDASARFSMPFFVHPRPDAVLRVLEACKGEGFPPPPEDITGAAFLAQRLREIGLM
jgi:isopenicillin N synthase-like dioxygenase